MRLYPPAWGMPRESIEADEIMGYHIPPKSAIVLGQFLTHRHPDFWEEPDQFRPERFLGEVPVNRPRFAYFPFGGGPRVCIGSQFAMIEAQLVLATGYPKVRDGACSGSSGGAGPDLHAAPQAWSEGDPAEARLSHGSTGTLNQGLFPPRSARQRLFSEKCPGSRSRTCPQRRTDRWSYDS